MASYLITYDLHRPGQDYSKLFEAIKRIGPNWWHCLDSTWIIKHNGPSESIRNALTPHIDSNDKMLVVKLSGEGAWIRFDNQCSQWLLDNLATG